MTPDTLGALLGALTPASSLASLAVLVRIYVRLGAVTERQTHQGAALERHRIELDQHAARITALTIIKP